MRITLSISLLLVLWVTIFNLRASAQYPYNGGSSSPHYDPTWNVLLPGNQETSSCPVGLDVTSLSVAERQVIPSSLNAKDWISARDTIIMGPKYSPFERPLPKLLDSEFLLSASDELNKEQPIFTDCWGFERHGAACSNKFVPEGQPFIVRLDEAYVTWQGLVFDSRYVYPPSRESGTSDVWVPYRNSTGFQKDLIEPAQNVVCFDKVITILQPYEDNYYHLVAEALPRLLIARQMLLRDPEMLLLTRLSRSFITQFFDILGIPLTRVINANVLEMQKTYIRAKQLFVPTPSKIFAVPKEALWSVRQAVTQMMKDEPVQERERNLLVYVTRRNTWSRRVENEEALIEVVEDFVQKTQPTLGLELVVFDSSEHSVQSAIKTFARARLIMGAHGAGFTNMLFSTEGTPVFEFLHSFSPLLCYWHMASALGMPYWMLPVTQSHWGGDLSIAPSEITAYLQQIFSEPEDPEDSCQPGWTPGVLESRQACQQCPVGMFSWGSECVPCAPGRYADTVGSSFCATCPPNTYSSAYGDKCISCPKGTGSRFWGTFPESCQPMDEEDDDQGKPLVGSYFPATYQVNSVYETHDNKWYEYFSAHKVRLLVSSFILIGLVACYILFRHKKPATQGNGHPYAALPTDA